MQESTSLKYRAWSLLRESARPHKDIAKEIGVSLPWVRLFLDGDIKSPSVDTVQKLYECLAGEPLFKGTSK